MRRLVRLFLIAFPLATAMAQDRPDISVLYGEPAASIPARANIAARMEVWKKNVRRSIMSPLAQSFFDCDYTSRTCMVGYHSQDRFYEIFVVLAEDRETVLAHFECENIYCIQVESGKVLDKRSGGEFIRCSPPNFPAVCAALREDGLAFAKRAGYPVDSQLSPNNQPSPNVDSWRVPKAPTKWPGE